MEWHVQYRQSGLDRCALSKNFEQAIDTACRLLRGGLDVYGIGTVLGDSLGKPEIARLYADWAMAHPEPASPSLGQRDQLAPS